ncbi:axin dorsalization-associated protein [Plasmopara halstedii]|uniref:Axin dorsalization-associated protein n=1 Tax=Plasmopara halstedii TaxID=4781 RepID=A0A0P1AAS7_PLAHL|nr:axin dorsalization-associated protein [Plasmopara halstedii]CEG37537.1 axin dorsalization-associated protein [Plasmopara halstedii]|eukprot:XP_024573906.1 axin dorsalization-associated protein [Plasmopara halstedii]
MEHIVKLHAAWCRSLQQAIELDMGGEELVGVEAYERLASRMTKALPACHRFTDAQKQIIENVIAALEMRAMGMSSAIGQRRPTKEDMADVLHALHGAMSNEPEILPIHISQSNQSTQQATPDEKVGNEINMKSFVAETANASALRSLKATYLDIQIVKIGLKDANVYMNPTIVVSIVDYSGKLMEETHETGVGACTELQYVMFSTHISLATNVRKMEDYGAAVVFEFFHYKAKKRKKSCRCWALLEMANLRNGHTMLELYQKPMDPKRKRIYLFTEKKLYLHLDLKLQTR